jgi:DNA repair photolyase
MNTIYAPKGKAKEYGDYALNIYKGCPHRCFYCFAPNVLHREKEKFHSCVEPRENIVKETAKYLETHDIKGKIIHLCFTCDPYPTGYDSTPTREIIKLIKDSGNFVQILTKGDGSRDFDLLDENDLYGITLDQNLTDKYAYNKRVFQLIKAHSKGIKTWISFEPVINAERCLEEIKYFSNVVDKVKIGKLNYYTSDIDWKAFGEKAEALCKQLKLDYYIKDSLRLEMNGSRI